MTNTTTATAAPPGPAETILRVLRAAERPLTVNEIKKRYDGPKLPKDGLPRLLQEEQAHGRVFVCSPAGKKPRYWAHDEAQRIHEKAVELLNAGPMPESKLVTALNKALPKVSSPPAIREFVQRFFEERRLHRHPGKGKATVVAARPLDPASVAKLKESTLKDLRSVYARLQPFGISVDQVLDLVRRELQAMPLPASPARSGAAAAPVRPTPTLEIDEVILKGMRDLEPSVAEGMPVSLRELRRHMPSEYRGHDTFDRAVLRLAADGRVAIQRHDQPAHLMEEEREELVRDEAGDYFTTIAQRV